MKKTVEWKDSGTITVPAGYGVRFVQQSDTVWTIQVAQPVVIGITPAKKKRKKK
jgi:hypothetical protein